MSEEDRPAKRIKTGMTSEISSLATSPTLRGDAHKGQTQGRQNRRTHSSQVKRVPEDHDASHERKKTESPRTFSQPSVMCTGDRGIFVTCDKGREKKSLLELRDLIQQYLEDGGLDIMGTPIDHALLSSGRSKGNEVASSNSDEIESEIAIELATLRDTKMMGQVDGPRPMQLITLDIPCVSFLRLPPSSLVNPVDIVHQLCLRAAEPSSTQSSRYIKRLTPISNLAKALSQGLERICDNVLPLYFGPGNSGTIQAHTFAIRPTIRNNDKLDRNQAIQLVAGKIEELGKGAHKVDLKHYDKGVLVEVYRGWVGISVVDNASGGSYEKGYDELKRFNLAEIYANR